MQCSYLYTLTLLLHICLLPLPLEGPLARSKLCAVKVNLEGQDAVMHMAATLLLMLIKIHIYSKMTGIKVLKVLVHGKNMLNIFQMVRMTPRLGRVKSVRTLWKIIRFSLASTLINSLRLYLCSDECGIGFTYAFWQFVCISYKSSGVVLNVEFTCWPCWVQAGCKQWVPSYDSIQCTLQWF